MSGHNKLLAKYHEKLRSQNQESGAQKTEETKEPEKKHVANPFLKSSNQPTSEMEAPSLPKVSQQAKPTNNFEANKVFNSSNEFVRLTTEVFPTPAIFPSVCFPVACFLKPFGNAVT